MVRELYGASARSIFCFASATALSLYGAKVRSVDREMSGKSARAAFDAGAPIRPLARGDDLMSPIAVCVCCCHRRALKEPPSFSLNATTTIRFGTG